MINSKTLRFILLWIWLQANRIALVDIRRAFFDATNIAYKPRKKVRLQLSYIYLNKVYICSWNPFLCCNVFKQYVYKCVSFLFRKTYSEESMDTVQPVLVDGAKLFLLLSLNRLFWLVYYHLGYFLHWKLSNNYILLKFRLKWICLMFWVFLKDLSHAFSVRFNVKSAHLVLNC